MILFQDHSIILTLQEDTNILCVRWLDQEIFKMEEFELTFNIMMQKIEQYGIKKILAYPCKALISLPDEKYLSVITLLQSGFAYSHIEKIARIYLDQSRRDLQCIAYFKQMLAEMQLDVAFEVFESTQCALTWLTKPKKFVPAPIIKGT